MVWDSGIWTARAWMRVLRSHSVARAKSGMKRIEDKKNSTLSSIANGRKGKSASRVVNQLKMNSPMDARIHPVPTLCSLRRITTMNQAQFSETLSPFQVSDYFAHLQISAKRICQFHLSRRLTLHIEQRRTRHEYSHTLRARGRDIQPVSTVQEFHSARRILVS